MLGVRAAASALNETAEAIDRIGKTAEDLGLATETVSAFSYAAQMAGVGADELLGSLSALAKRIGEYATTGKGKAAEAIESLGLSVRDANGNIRSMEDLLPDLSDRFATVGNETQKAYLANKLFGDSGVGVLRFLSSGREAIQAYTEEARRLGVVFSAEDAAVADDYGDALDRVKFAFMGVKTAILREVAPALADFFNSAASHIAALPDIFRTTYRSINEFSAGMLTTGSENLASWLLATQNLVITAAGDLIQVLSNILPDLVMWGLERVGNSVAVWLQNAIEGVSANVSIGMRYVSRKFVENSNFIAEAVLGVARVTWSAVSNFVFAAGGALVKSVGAWVADAMSQVFGTIAKNVEGVAVGLSVALGPAATAGLSAMSGAIRTAAQSVASESKAAADVLKNLPDPATIALNSFNADLISVMKRVRDVSNIAGDYSVKMEDLRREMQGLAAIDFEQVLASMNSDTDRAALLALKDGIAGTSGKLKELAGQWVYATNELTGFSAHVEAHAIPALQKLQTELRKSNTELTKVFTWDEFGRGWSDAFGKWTESANNAFETGKSAATQFLNLSVDSMGDAAFQISRDWRNTGNILRSVFSSLSEEISKLLFKMAAMRILSSFFGAFGSGGGEEGARATGGGWEGFLNNTAYHGGFAGRSGISRYALGGFSVPGPNVGRDMVHAILAPGELVVPRYAVAANDRSDLAYLARGGRIRRDDGDSGGAVNVNVNLGSIHVPASAAKDPEGFGRQLGKGLAAALVAELATKPGQRQALRSMLR